MTLTCRPLRDPTARALCEALGALHADQGVEEINYLSRGVAPTTRGAGDQTIEAAEVYRAALVKNHALFTRITGHTVPWIFSATNRVRLEKELLRLRTSLAAAGIAPHHARYRENFARSIDALIRRTFNVSYKNHVGNEGTADDVLSRGYARCSEYVTLFYGIALMAGLTTYPMEIHQDTGLHAAIAVATGTTARPRHLIVDGQLGILERPPYRHYYFGGAADVFASYLYNKSVVLAKTATPAAMTTAGGLLAFAAQVAPHNAVVHFGLGSHYHEQRQWRTALQHYRTALRLRPTDPTTKQRYCFMKIMAGLGGCRRSNTLP